MKAKYFGLLIFILFIALMYISTKEEKSDCYWQEEFNKQYLHGVIIEKYIDSTSHSVHVIEVLNFDSVKSIRVSLAGDRNNVYNALSKFDTIYKGANSSEILVVKNKKMHSVGSVDFGCEAE